MLKTIFYTAFLWIVVIFLACKSTISEKETDFSIQDTSAITKILITKEKDTLILTKKDNKWTVNDMYNASNESVKRLMNTLSLLELNMPLPDNAVEHVKKDLRQKGIKVEVFSGKKELKSCFIGDYIKGTGNYVMLEDAEKPYIAYIPSHIFDIRKNFTTDIKNWQSKLIFNVRPSDIQSVYLRDSVMNSEFFLYKKEDKWTIAKDTLSIGQEASIDAVKRYLGYFSNIKFLRYKETGDSAGYKIFVLQLTTINGKKYNLNAYALIKKDKTDKNVFIGNMNGKFSFLANYYDFDLLRKNQDFFK